MPDMEIQKQDMANYIALRTIPSQLKYIQKYIGKTWQRKNVSTTKMWAQHIISLLLLNWQRGSLEHDSRQVQQEEDKGILIPTWKYQRSIKGVKRKGRNYILNKTDEAKTKKRR